MDHSRTNNFMLTSAVSQAGSGAPIFTRAAQLFAEAEALSPGGGDNKIQFRSSFQLFWTWYWLCLWCFCWCFWKRWLKLLKSAISPGKCYRLQLVFLGHARAYTSWALSHSMLGDLKAAEAVAQQVRLWNPGYNWKFSIAAGLSLSNPKTETPENPNFNRWYRWAQYLSPGRWALCWLLGSSLAASRALCGHLLLAMAPGWGLPLDEDVGRELVSRWPFGSVWIFGIAGFGNLKM